MVKLNIMLKKLIHDFRRMNQRFAINICRNVFYGRKKPRVKNESQVVSICKNVICMVDSSLEISPISVNRIIKNERLKIKISIKDEIINIQGELFPYKDCISKRGLEFIISTFDNELEKRINLDEKEIESRLTNYVTNSLKTMLNTIKNEKIQ
jgi:hypothetical protein